MTQRDPRQSSTTGQPPRWVTFRLGPSCLLSLVIVFLLLLLIRRFVPLGFIGVGVLALVIWFAVFSVLMRRRMGSRGDVQAPEDDLLTEDIATDELPANVVEAEWWDADERRG